MLELSDYDENEEAHKSSNVECVEVNNGIKMANKRSKSLEKEAKKKTVDIVMYDSRRPDTAPPLLLLPDVVARANKETVNEEAQKIIELKTEPTTSWHEHVYRKPPKIPTPYSIADILQWGSDKKPRDEIKTSDNNNNSSRSYQHVEPSTLQHLLNLNINSPPNNGNDMHARHTSSNGISSRGLSFSETSDEDESVASDQPLNLCVIKSRDSSPGIMDRSVTKSILSSGKLKKGVLTESVCVYLCGSINLRFLI
jgi:hypothetical protein